MFVLITHLLMAYRVAVSEGTGHSPFFLLHDSGEPERPRVASAAQPAARSWVSWLLSWIGG